jgi:hypothetical protein
MSFYWPYKAHGQAATRKRLAEKSAVTKRAQRQKVSLARIPSLEAGREDGRHGPNTPEADVSDRHEGSRLEKRREPRGPLDAFPRGVQRPHDRVRSG